MAKEWVVYSKATLSHTESVVGYLARYTHRIAINNHRILDVNERQVTLRYKAYREQGQQRELTLSGEEFVRRYLMHIVAKGFMRIRHYGFLANCCRKRCLTQIRQHLDALPPPDNSPKNQEVSSTPPCPLCHTGRLILIAEMLPQMAERIAMLRR